MPRRFTGGRLLVATHNRGKVAEIRGMLHALALDIVSAAELGLAAPEETGATFEENAALKARAAATAARLPALADDSGLCVAALDGKPGVVTADWEGPTRDAMVGMSRIQRELGARGVPDTPDARRATFVCVLAMAWPDGECAVVRGEMPGHVVWPPRGTGGHGYDPTFQPEGSSLTCAEMAPDAKNAISHRGAAFRKLIETCFK
jgi:XTP/dITP diphosphohydrolase